MGHGALAEKALLPVLPSPEAFPYAIRITAETVDSNGSSSMAAVCGGLLALLDAGVPVLEPVAGVSVGLAIEKSSPPSKDCLLLDITGTEDHYGASCVLELSVLPHFAYIFVYLSSHVLLL